MSLLRFEQKLQYKNYTDKPTAYYYHNEVEIIQMNKFFY